MIDFPSTDWLDDDCCPRGLARHRPPEGVTCPHSGSHDRRLFRAQGHVPAYRGRGCDGDDTWLTGTVFATTRQPPAPLVRWRRGMATGEPTARLARELRRSRQPLHTVRQRLQATLHETAPTAARLGPAVAADELYPDAGEHTHAPS